MYNFILRYGAYEYELEDIEDDSSGSYAKTCMFMRFPELENNCVVTDDEITRDGKRWKVLTFTKIESTNN
jgi:hypothetical protein